VFIFLRPIEPHFKNYFIQNFRFMKIIGFKIIRITSLRYYTNINIHLAIITDINLLHSKNFIDY
jgi:hypothetical protein